MKHRLVKIQVTIIVPPVLLLVANFKMVTHELSLEEEERSVSRGRAVEAQELLLLPDPFFTGMVSCQNLL